MPPLAPSMPRTLYLANGLGFSASARALCLAPLVRAVEALGVHVIEPFADNNEVSLAHTRTVEQELEIARLDMEGVRKSDGVLCVSSAPIPDEGAMVEVGLALAWGKPVFLLNDDFRYGTGGETLPMNLMLFAGMAADTWKDFYYTSVEELADPERALARWAKGAD